MVDLETSYICIIHRIDNFFVVRIASIARTILASVVCVCIVLLWNCRVRKIERCVVGENAQVACMRRSLMNHVTNNDCRPRDRTIMRYYSDRNKPGDNVHICGNDEEMTNVYSYN